MTNSGGGNESPPDGCIFFNAYLDIEGQKDEILTQNSNGCGYAGGMWQINLGNFPNGWSTGDILHIDFIDKCKGEEGFLNITLTDSGQASDIILAPISFELVTTGSTNVNVVILIKDSGVVDAEGLAQVIENVTEISYWSAEDQAYIGHSKGSPLHNFTVHSGYPYFVTVSAGSTWTPTGSVPDSWPNFKLITTGLTNVNMVGMSPDKLRITTAEELGHMTLNTREIGRWDAATQAYEFHTYATPLFNFDIKPALPYFVTVTEESMLMSVAQSCVAAAGGVPQNEGGDVYNFDTTMPGNGEIMFTAYILGRENETLTENSPGCGYENGYWQVNLGNFPSSWDDGDVLRIDFQNTINGEEGNLDITLEYLGQFTDVTLAPLPCAGDFNGDGDVDGSDLAEFITGTSGVDLQQFAGHFGRINCP